MDYVATFRTYIQQNVDYTLEQVKREPGLLSDQTCQHALHALSYALKTQTLWPVARELLLLMAAKMELAGARQHWLPYLQQGLLVSREQDDAEAEGRLSLFCGYIHQLCSDLAKAQQFYQQAIERFRTVGATRMMGVALNRLAYVARLLRQYEAAQQAVRQAINLLPSDDSECAISFDVLGWIAFDRHEWQTSAAYFQQALVAAESTHNREQAARYLYHVASALQMQKKVQEAILYHLQAIELLAQGQDRFEQAAAQMNLGVAYLLVEEWQKSLEVLDAADKIFRHYQDQIHQAMTATNRGIALRGLRRWEQAIESLQTGLNLFELLDDVPNIVNCLVELGKTWLASGERTQARTLFNRALKKLTALQTDLVYQSIHREIVEQVEGMGTM